MSFWDTLKRKGSDRISPTTGSKKYLDKVEDYLPQAIEDQTIIDKFHDIHENLENHVDFFYNEDRTRSQQQTSRSESFTPIYPPKERLTSSSRPTSVMLVSDSQQGMPASQTEVDSTSLLKSPKLSDDMTPKRHAQKVIAQRLFAGIQPFASDPNAGLLLPKEITAFLFLTPDPIKIQSDPVYMSALGQWRTLTSYLTHHRLTKGNENIFKEEVGKAIEKMIENLDNELEPFRNGSDNDRRRNHLSQQARKVVDLGLDLSSQVAQYGFDWSTSAEDEQNSDLHTSQFGARPHSRARQSGYRRRHRKETTKHEESTLVVFPGLVKYSDHNGNKLMPAKRLSEPQQIKYRKVRRQRTDSSHLE